MQNVKTLSQINANGKRVFVRVDFNVPIDENGQITDATRIERAKPTIDSLREMGTKVILLSHFGRPKGEVVPSMSLQGVAKRLGASSIRRFILPRTALVISPVRQSVNSQMATYCFLKTPVFMRAKRKMILILPRPSQQMATFMSMMLFRRRTAPTLQQKGLPTSSPAQRERRWRKNSIFWAQL